MNMSGQTGHHDFRTGVETLKHQIAELPLADRALIALDCSAGLLEIAAFEVVHSEDRALLERLFFLAAEAQRLSLLMRLPAGSGDAGALLRTSA